MKLSAALIIRDDESTLEECLKSIRPHVDELVVVDTGSKDRSPEIAKKYADKWELYLGCNNPDTGLIEDFSDARQKSLELCTGDAFFWFDGDDIVDGGEHLREIVKAHKVDNLIALLPYEYSHDEHGNVTCLHFRERLVFPRYRYQWQSPVHEVLCPIEPVQGSRETICSSDVVIRHRQSKSTKAREPHRNLRILEAYVKKTGEGDPRAMYYLGLEYQRVGNFGDAWRIWERYVELSGWAEERCLAMLGIAQCYQHLGHHKQAIDWALKALLEKSWPEPHYVIGKSFYSWARRGVQGEPQYNFTRCQYWLRRGLEREGQSERLLFANPRAKYEVQEELNFALAEIGDIEGAIQSCEFGLQGLPDNEMMANNLRSLKAQRARIRISKELPDAGLSKNSIERVRAVLNEDFQVESTEELEPIPGALEPASPGKLDLVFFCGPAWEHWTPDKLKAEGMGGSETMAWELSKRLAAQGHRVRIYAHVLPTDEGVYEGVGFYDYQRFGNLECDVLVVSRLPAAIDAPGLKAKAKVLWVHDVHCGEELTLERDRKFDRIFVLSEWHRETFLQVYPMTDPSKVVVTRNGIDLDRFQGDVERDPHRAIYSSSPDRGLLTALEIWPEVRKQVPDATLHIYYGFYNWEQNAKQRGDKDNLTNIAHLRHLIETTEGVHYHDRVNQQELAQAMLASGVWCYPTWFTETSCITAMECQAARMYGVTSPIAALNETAKDWALFVEGDWRDEDYKKRFTEKLLLAMRAGDLETRGSIRKKASRFSLDTLAEEWSETFFALCTTLEVDVVPKFVDVQVPDA